MDKRTDKLLAELQSLIGDWNKELYDKYKALEDDPQILDTFETVEIMVDLRRKKKFVKKLQVIVDKYKQSSESFDKHE